MENVWVKTETDVEAYDWQEKPIVLKGIPAIKNKETGQVRVFPSEVAKAEISLLAKERDLAPRDVALLTLIYVKPGPFTEGKIHCKYHLNKMLFYQWVNMGRRYLGEAFPHDEFRSAPAGPIPNSLWDDLRRLEKKGLVILKHKQWGKTEKEASLCMELTEEGSVLTEELWKDTPPDFKEVTLKTKKDIFPLDPATIKEKVHREFPEYRKTYTELDQE